MKIATTCPQCECPMWESTTVRTADAHRAWKDVDGTWYNGPAREDTKRRCAACGWSQSTARERGKLVSVESDPITPPPSPAAPA